MPNSKIKKENKTCKKTLSGKHFFENKEIIIRLPRTDYESGDYFPSMWEKSKYKYCKYCKIIKR